jgi:hypothetical protein
MNPMRSLARCPLDPIASGLDEIAGELLEESLPEATINGEWKYAACRICDRSHATTAQPSTASIHQFLAWEKASTVSSGS